MEPNRASESAGGAGLPVWLFAIAVAALGAGVAAVALRKSVDHDEIAHLHSAWLVWKGLLPSADFQARHHPLYYYLTAWLCGWIDDPAGLLLAHRTLMAGNLLLLGALVVEAGRRLTDLRAALWAGTFFFTGAFLTAGFIEVRPDTLQATLSFCALLALMPGLSRRPLFVSAALTGLAICVLQKALLALVAMAPAIIWAAGAGEERAPARTARRLLGFAVAAALPVLLLLVPYLRAGKLDDYFLYCWKFNASYVAYRQTDGSLWRWAFEWSPHLWLLAAAGLAVGLRTPRERMFVSVPLALNLLQALASGAQFKQYLFASLPLAALAAALGHREVVRHRAARLPYALVLAGLLVAFPLRFYGFLPSHRPMFAAYGRMMQLFERNVPATERVLDDDHLVNVRRFSISFNWFGRPEDFEDLSAAAGRDMRPDRIGELQRYKPPVVVLGHLYPKALRDLYQSRYVPTPYQKVFVVGQVATADAGGRVRLDIWKAGRYVLSPAGGSATLGGHPWNAAGEWLPEGPCELHGLAPGQEVCASLPFEG